MSFFRSVVRFFAPPSPAPEPRKDFMVTDRDDLWFRSMMAGMTLHALGHVARNVLRKERPEAAPDHSPSPG